MGSYCELYINGCEVFSSKSYVVPEVMTLFRESDKVVHKNIVTEDDDEYEQTVVEYKALATNVTQRLDIMGFSLKKVMDDFESIRANKILELSEYVAEEPEDYWKEELALYEENSFESYLDAFKTITSSGTHPVYYLQENPNSSKLIQSILSDYNEDFYWAFPCSDIRCFCRALLEIAPQDSFVKQDISALVYSGYYEIDENVCKEALNELTFSYPSNSKIIILTEGITDKEVIEQSLKLLYPHLYEYYSFMDFSFLPPGGAGNLVNLLKSFSGAGITNKVLALFDNDTAAFSAVESLRTIHLPDNIKILHYPDIDLAKKYPTIGPNDTSFQDINGSACSIELYFGEDILKESGALTPVQWKSLDNRINKYQGEIQNKDKLKQKFMGKLKKCQESPSLINPTEWKDVDVILKRIFSATHV
ncbi:MAG: hypothetical protein IMY71_05335 [Bacteroidetes bacterium]|jgi:hypothetical protein|nr:hypothetical protein [Bacteroidota bacterium]